MQALYNILIALALAVVAFILAWGFYNMFKGGDPNRSQKLMRARVIAQGIAILVIMGALLLFGSHHG